MEEQQLENYYEIGLDLSKLKFNTVKTINKSKFKGKVYDLHVDGIHNYNVKDVGIVHNGGNKRKGSFAVYLEPWHSDVFTLIDIKKNTGSEDLRARDLFPALWIPDLFMARVRDDGDWCLFCPDESPG